MFDDLQAYFFENVVPAFTAYRDIRANNVYGRSNDLRAALIAASSLYHFREHLPTKPSRASIASRCSDFDLLGDIVNASKHGELSHGTPQLTAAQDITDRLVSVEYVDAEGTYHVPWKLVIAKLTDGTERDVFDVLTNVINFWGQELLAQGTITEFEPFPKVEPPGSRFVARTSSCGSANVNIEGIASVRMMLNFQFMKYDPALGCAKPIDLTGRQHEFRVFEPPKASVTITERENATGREVKRTIQLSDEQASQFRALKSNEERDAFKTSLAHDLMRNQMDLLESMHAELTAPADEIQPANENQSD